MALTHGIKPIVTSNLILCLDAINSKSYPGSGATWTDLINSNTASLDTPTFSNGTLNFGGIYDIVSSNYNLTLGSSFSISLWLKHTNSNPVGQRYITLGFDKIVVRVNDAGNLNLYVTDATEQNLLVWGWNNGGDAGTNDGGTVKNTPVTTFTGGTTWKQVSAGYPHMAAIKTDGSLWTWGLNTDGRLGINSTTGISRSTPVTTFAGGTNWKQISVGRFHMAAIKTDGTLWTWGRSERGQLGNNQGIFTADRLTPVTTFAGGNTWKSVNCGDRHTAAIKTDGSLWVWGINEEGQLGDNTTVSKSIPVTTFAGGNTWKSVACGRLHTAAIKTDGTLWTWGQNDNGRLGTNDTTRRSTPVTTFSGGTNWKQVDCGEAHTMAVKTDGTLWGWGQGSVGRLGTNGNSSAVPVTTFAGGNNWKQVSCSNANGVAIRTNETTTTDVSISTPLLNTTYYNIVATSNGTTLKLYQNNSLLTTANLNGTLTSTTLFYTISDIMNSFAGNLANIQIHNKELTATEVAQNYDALKGRYGLT